MDIIQIFKLATDAGFSHSKELNMDALIFRDEIREMCAADRCKHFAKSWSCPPACGTLPEISQKASSYKNGILVQTTGNMEDAFDYDTIVTTERQHKQSFNRFVQQIKILFPLSLPMSSGTCTLCKKCMYPDRPCRYPDRVFPSMEAYGLWVSDVCEKSGLNYYYGPNTITFTACILLEMK